MLRTLAAGRARRPAHIRSHVPIDTELTMALIKFAALDPRRLDGESKEQVAAVGAAAEQWLCAEYRKVHVGLRFYP